MVPCVEPMPLGATRGSEVRTGILSQTLIVNTIIKGSIKASQTSGISETKKIFSSTHA